MLTEDLLTVEQAAARLNMSTRYVRRLVAERRIVFYRLGRSVRLRAEDVAAFVTDAQVPALTAERVWRQTRYLA